MERYRTFRVKFLQPTDHRSAKILIHDLWHGDRKIIPYSYSERGDNLDRAIDYLNDYGIKIDAIAQVVADRGYTSALTTDFETRLK